MHHVAEALQYTLKFGFLGEKHLGINSLLFLQKSVYENNKQVPQFKTQASGGIAYFS